MRNLNPSTKVKITKKLLNKEPIVIIQLNWDQALVLRALLYDPVLISMLDQGSQREKHPWHDFVDRLHNDLHKTMGKPEDPKYA